MLKIHEQKKQSYSHYLHKLLSNADLFGESPNFSIAKRAKFTSPIGLFFTIAIASVCLTYFIFQIQELLQQSNPSIIVSELQSLASTVFPLTHNNFTLGIVMTGLNFSALPTLDRYFQMKLQNCMRFRKLDPITGTLKITQNCVEYPLEGCQLGKHFVTDYQLEYFGKFKPNSVFCANSSFWNETPMNLQGSVQADDFQYLLISITICKNATNNSNCAPEEESIKALKQGYFAIHLADSLIKMDKSGKPYEDIITFQYSTFSSSNSKFLTSALKIVETQTDDGIIKESKRFESFLTQGNIKESQELYNEQYLIQNIITIDQKKATYQRSYLKIQAILGNIGGLWQVLYLVIGIFISPITIMLMNLQMANQLFTFQQQSNKENISQFKKDQLSFKQMANSPRENQSSQKYIPSGILGTKKDLLLQSEIIKYLKQRSQSLQLGVRDIMMVLCGCKKLEKKQIDYTTNKIITKLDIVNLLSKMQEIDKLKQVLLTQEQQQLFEYIPKPNIPLEFFDKQFEEKVDKLESVKQYNYIFQEEKTDQVKIKLALQAYINIQNSRDRSYADQQMLGYLDDDITEIFEYAFQQQRRNSQEEFGSKSIIYFQEDKDSPKFNGNEELSQVIVNAVPELKQKK